MYIEILQPCQLAPDYSVFLPGRIVDIPEPVALAWIELGRAKPMEPAIRVKETATRKRKKETR